MTCIVSYIDEENKKVWMGGDTAGSNGYDIRYRRDTKVFIKKDVREEHSFIFGYTTSFRMAQILRFSFVVPEVPKNKDIYEYMCTDFINAVRDCFKSGGFSRNNSGEESGGKFLVGMDCGRVFEIESDYQVGEIENLYNSVGCGSSYAMGSLYSDSSDTVKKRVENSIRAASFFSCGVSDRFNIESINIK